MRRVQRRRCALSAALVLLVGSSPVWAQEGNVEAQANNPLTNLKAFNIQDYAIGEVTGFDKPANQIWLRYAQPVSIGDQTWRPDDIVKLN